MISTDARAAAYAAIARYMAQPGRTLNDYRLLLDDTERDIKDSYDSGLTSYQDAQRRLREAYSASLALEQHRRETEPVSAWALVKVTESGPACGHCAYGRGRDRVVMRHANASQVRRCADIQSAQAAEIAEELAAERRLERAHEEHGAGLEPDERAMLPW